MTRMVRLLLCVSLFAFFASASWAQGIFATLTGVVTDPSQSVVAGAKVTLRNIESGSARETVTNGNGFYTNASRPGCISPCIGSNLRRSECRSMRA